MKKVLLAASLFVAALTFAGTTTVNASKGEIETEKGRHISPSQVPTRILNKFNNQFPDATNVQWEKEREHGGVVYQAEFRLNGKTMKVQYAA